MESLDGAGLQQARRPDPQAPRVEQGKEHTVIRDEEPIQSSAKRPQVPTPRAPAAGAARSGARRSAACDRREYGSESAGAKRQAIGKQPAVQAVIAGRVAWGPGATRR